MSDWLGHHGEAIAGTPFVWNRGKLYLLPLPVNVENGHIYDGNEKLMAGSVEVDNWPRPAVWKPDLKEGWKKTSVTILTDTIGSVQKVAPDGGYWIKGKNGELRRFHKGKWENTIFQRFELQAIDHRNRLYGNQFSGFGVGEEILGNEPSMWEKGRWNVLEKSEGYKESYLNDANSTGEAVGHFRQQAVLWKNGQRVNLADDTLSWSRAYSINEGGSIVGSFLEEKSELPSAILWKNDELIDISKAVSGIVLEAAMKITNRGSIVAAGHDGSTTKLYLLQPVKPTRK